ncbi:MAG: family 43 glycosylhydrolase, partial [Chloroflexota bacterium]
MATHPRPPARRLAVPPEAFYRPLHPDDRDQGDPYVLRVPPEVSAPFAYYTYITGENTAAGTAFPVYGSDDLVRWRPLGNVLVADATRAHWAPCVRHIPGLARPYVMLYSRAIGLGEDAHVGHIIRRADSTSPEGPFHDSGHVLTADLDFAIDPDVYRLRDGSLRLAFAMDFVDDPPLGTGIVETRISEDLTTIEGPIEVLARAQYDWQVYDPARKMPWKTIPGVDWAVDTVRWHTVEAPVGGLVSPQGRDVYLYSGGCFFDYYAVGALRRDERGRLADVFAENGHIVVRPRAEQGCFAPGHCSYVVGPDDQPYLMFHARYGAHDAPRQMSLAPLQW